MGLLYLYPCLSVFTVVWEKKATIKLQNKFPYALTAETGICYIRLPFTASPIGENRGEKTGNTILAVEKQ
jgi:hypothetical protein